MESNFKSNTPEFFKGIEVYIYKKDGNFKVGVIVGESEDFIFLSSKKEGKISISKTEIAEIKPNYTRGASNGNH